MRLPYARDPHRTHAAALHLQLSRTRPEGSDASLLDQACKCVNPEHKCYVDHYAGKCECNCNDCAGCDCDCVLLARLDESGDDPDHPAWTPDHRVRRFVRPVLMRDPQRSRRTREGNPPPTLRGKRSPSPERSCGSCDHGGGTCLGAQAGRRGAAAGGRSADRRSCRRGAPDAGGAHVAATPGQSRHTDICCARDSPGKRRPIAQRRAAVRSGHSQSVSLAMSRSARRSAWPRR
jgi:hypothetical protein